MDSSPPLKIRWGKKIGHMLKIPALMSAFHVSEMNWEVKILSRKVTFIKTLSILLCRVPFILCNQNKGFLTVLT